MKDVRGNILKSGQQVHIFGGEGDSALDFNAVVVNTRGRGVKFIDEVTGKEYRSEFIEENQLSIVILGDNFIQEEKIVTKNNKITQEQLDTIDKLVNWGWFGVLYKNVNGNKFQFNITEK